MNNHSHRPTIGLALSGSGNRTTFYVGFLEGLVEQQIPIDYISACSGASLVAAAYACGELPAFKEEVAVLDSEKLKQYVHKSTQRGGLYGLDFMEQRLRDFTKGHTFEEVKPHMSFVTVDIETGEQINLCMGDIARAARISCTLPGVFTPAKWGNRTLVDGGLLSLVPLDALKEFSPDITIGLNMRGTKHIFTEGQITFKKILNFLSKVLFLDEVGGLLSFLKFSETEADLEQNPSALTVLNKCLNLAIEAEKKDHMVDLSCDLMITPNVPKIKSGPYPLFSPYYEIGKKCAEEYGPKIKELIRVKQEQMEKVGV